MDPSNRSRKEYCTPQAVLDEALANLQEVSRLNRDGHGEQSIILLQQILQVADEHSDHRLRIDCETQYGRTLSLLGEYEKASVYYERVLEYFRICGSPRQLGVALNNVANNFHFLGKSDEAIRCWQEAVEYFQLANDHRQTASVVANLAGLHLDRYDFEASEKCFRHAIRELDEFEQWERASQQRLKLARLLSMTDRFDEAHELIDHAIQYSESSNDPMLMAEFENMRGIINLLARNLTASKLFFENTLEQFRALQNNRGIGVTENNLGTIEVFLGRLASAKKHFLAARDALVAAHDTRASSTLQFNLGLLSAVAGNYEKALDYYMPSLEAMRSTGLERFSVFLQVSIGMAHINLGQCVDAEFWLEGALELANKLGNPSEKMAALATISRLYAVQGRVKDTERCYRETLLIDVQKYNRDMRANCLFVEMWYRLSLFKAGAEPDWSIAAFDSISHRQRFTVLLNRLQELNLTVGEWQSDHIRALQIAWQKAGVKDEIVTREYPWSRCNVSLDGFEA